MGTLFGSQTPLNFASWMAFSLPTVLLNLFLCWAWLQVYFIGLPWRRSMVTIGSQAAIKKLLVKKYAELGPITFQQLAVLLHFTVLVALWFFREPRWVECRGYFSTSFYPSSRFMPGWGDFFVEEEVGECGAVSESQVVDDASSAMLIVFLLFIFPSELSFWPFTSAAESRVAPSLLDWQFVQKRFPWTVPTWAVVVVICFIMGGLI